MARNLIMLGICLISAVLLVMIMSGFLKRLKRIEEDFWGKAAADAGRELEKTKAAEEASAALKRKAKNI
jgi:hypothetical protein